MADEDRADESGSRRSRLVTLTLAIVAGIILIVLIVVTTMYFTGYFSDDKSTEVEETILQLEKEAEATMQRAQELALDLKKKSSRLLNSVDLKIRISRLIESWW